MIEGQLEWRVGPDLEPHTGAAGSFVSVPRDVLHTFRNPGPGPARFLNLHAPGLGFERYLRGDFPEFDQHYLPEGSGLPPDRRDRARPGRGRAARARRVDRDHQDSASTQIGVFEAEVGSDFPHPPAHRHLKTMETFYVLEGELGLSLDDERVDAPARRLRRGPAGHRPYLPAVGSAAPVPERVRAGRHGGLPARGRAAGRAAGRLPATTSSSSKDPAKSEHNMLWSGRIRALQLVEFACVLCPFCSADSTQVIDTRPDPRRRAPAARVRRLRRALHHLRARRGAAPRRAQARRPPRALRPPEAAARPGARGRRAAGQRTSSSRRWRRGSPPRSRRGGGEAQAERIGDLAERGLARVDPVSAIQFASVYRNLADLDELEAVVRRFKEDPLPGEDQLAIEAPVPSDPESSIGRSREIRPTKRRGHVRQP